jgi:hypothetical protein
MDSRKNLVMKMGGGYLKALLPHRDETVFGRDVQELSGRLKLIGFRDSMSLIARKRTT